MSQYNHTAIEKKWRENWEKHPINVNDGKKEKYYCLDMFPYPSGSGLHVGHWRGYVISDVWSRYQLLRGKYVIHPMGWDAFGLPAENYAIKMGVHPAISTESNIKNIKRQINEIAAIYDWDMEVNTTDPAFYKWTQWIFVQMFKKGLAYEKEFPINWCPSCKTGLANEEVVNGCCERCGTPVTKKNLRQWMLKITAYADRLLNDLDKLDWPEKVKKMQTDWIGKSYGAEVDFGVEGRDEKITVYTTRPDTLYGATFMVLAPEHAMAKSLATDDTREAVEKYIFDSSMRSNVDRLQDKEKTGVFTGTYAINPINGAKVPIWLSDYVLADYGTGAIMCVPAHDDRDFEFAKKFNIPIIQVIAKDGKEIENMTEAYTEASGTMINSGEWNGMESSVLKKEAPEMIEKRGIGHKRVNYKLRDWVFSRQRYWGEPIPIVHCPKCGNVPVPEDQLPLKLPEVESYQPTGTGESPLAAIDEWVNTTCPCCGAPAKRETNTMPQWAGSSWYFLRYVDNKNDKELVSREKADKYLPVDMYIGGVEHAVLHLLCKHLVGRIGLLKPYGQPPHRRQGIHLFIEPQHHVIFIIIGQQRHGPIHVFSFDDPEVLSSGYHDAPLIHRQCHHPVIDSCLLHQRKGPWTILHHGAFPRRKLSGHVHLGPVDAVPGHIPLIHHLLNHGKGLHRPFPAQILHVLTCGQEPWGQLEGGLFFQYCGHGKTIPFFCGHHLCRMEELLPVPRRLHPRLPEHVLVIHKAHIIAAEGHPVIPAVIPHG